MVGLPLATGSGGGLAHQPLLRHRRHAEESGGIEMDGGCGKPLLVRIARSKRPQLVGRRRERCWPTSRSAERVGLWLERQRPLVVLQEALG